MTISLLHKIIVCCLAGLLCLFGLQADVNHHVAGWLNRCLLALCAVLMLAAVAYIPVWQFRERRRLTGSSTTLAFWQGAIIYMEALVFFKFGLLKLFGLHMTSSLILGDFPGDAISGYHLMDYFFGRAPLFKLIIGWLQLAGAAALLFRKTRLLGIFILMPIIVNIALMDLLYKVGQVAVLANLMLLGLLYLLFQEREKLLRFFFNMGSAMPALRIRNNILKNMVRLSSLGIPCLVLVPAIRPVSNSEVLGKYAVTALKINGKDMTLDKNNDSLLAAVYFDQNATCLLRYNNYNYFKIGGASYDAKTGLLKVRWRYPERQNDTVLLRFSGPENHKVLAGRIGGDSISAVLVKTALPTEVIK